MKIVLRRGRIAGQFGDNSSLDLEAAYSPAPNVRILVDGFKFGRGQSHLLEAGAGYYQRQGSSSWDTYGIVGFGGVENHFSQEDVSASFIRYGLQPSAGFRSRYFDAFLASRLVGLRYYKHRRQ